MLAYGILACENCIIWRKPTEAFKTPLSIAESRTGKPTMVPLKILFYRSGHYPVGERIYAQSFRMWNRLRFHPFMQVSQIFQRQKAMQITGFWKWVEFDKSSPINPLNRGILHLCSKCGDLVWMGDELSHGQAQNGVNIDFEVKFDLEGQGQSPQKQ